MTTTELKIAQIAIDNMQKTLQQIWGVPTEHGALDMLQCKDKVLRELYMSGTRAWLNLQDRIKEGEQDGSAE
jgi:hypothetical protein